MSYFQKFLFQKPSELVVLFPQYPVPGSLDDFLIVCIDFITDFPSSLNLKGSIIVQFICLLTKHMKYY